MNELNPQDTSDRRSAASDSTSAAKPVAGSIEPSQRQGRGTGKALPPSAANAAATERTPKVDEAVVKLNDYVQSLQRELKFTVDAELGRSVVSVVDSNTQQVIRKIPNDVAIRLARNLKDVQDSRQSQALADNLSGSAAASGYAEATATELSLIDTKA